MHIAIIGVGGLGRAMAHGLSTQTDIDLTLCDKTASKCAGLNATVFTDVARAVAQADVVLLCVKPAVTPAVAQQVRSFARETALVVSCAAGVTTTALGVARSARAMPSVGVAQHRSVTALYVPHSVHQPEDEARVVKLFAALGGARLMKTEALLDVATALTGCGPAFVLLAIEAMIDAGVEHGLPRQDARHLAHGALLAAAGLDFDDEPVAHRARITSPGGVTAAGLAALERGAVRADFAEAVRAAVAKTHSLRDAR